MFDPKDLPTDYWDSSKLDQFWGYVTWFLKLNMPWVMIGTAVLVGCGVIAVILSIFYERNLPNEDYEDFEIQRHL